VGLVDAGRRRSRLSLEYLLSMTCLLSMTYPCLRHVWLGPGR
jgi:hypothetical protein